ncbi:MAG: bacillithiol biosynthesis cysteine-adding enzyme BshC [Bacteroidetes bacterium]|nr:bacillithiol biosynthesis cysteine-adding enzyme BshC [Bacteroidota bacterium]
MQLHKIALADTHSFSSFFIDYITQKESLKKYYHRFPSLENFESQIEDRKNFPATNRQTLHRVLTQQYQGLKTSVRVEANLQSLTDQKTFTVTTGHQLNIFTGPLYFIYKIITVINACKALKEKYPDYNFVPVYWMASEDHDYDEIKSFRLYGKKYTWVTNQTGAVGRFDPKSITNLLNELPGDTSLFKTAYTKHNTLANATRYYVNELFGQEGLIVIDADNHDLKSLFTRVIQQDLFENKTKTLVEEKNHGLEELGYHPQVFAREINFFYLDKNVRQRIERKDDHFTVVDTDLSFTKEEIEKLIVNEPEKFSPNVILRPLYQETILPNLAYVGGPAEAVYWLQLKGVFDHFNTPFPMLMPRNFAAVMDEPTKKKFDKTGLDLKDLFEEKNYLFNHWVTKNSAANLSLGKEIQAAEALFKKVKENAGQIDPTLLKHVDAKTTQMIQSLEVIERKMLRAEKRKHAEKLKQIEAVKDTLFPNQSPQERSENFLNFYQSDPQFILKLIEGFDPFDYRFHIFTP